MRSDLKKERKQQIPDWVVQKKDGRELTGIGGCTNADTETYIIYLDSLPIRYTSKLSTL
jgi:hypothetical protein